jgi:riboflavin synthase
MFTGIVEEVGTVARIETLAAGARIELRCRAVLADLVPGSSVAVNGVCLTAVRAGAESFAADLAPETLERSNLGVLRVGSKVNLERPLSPTGRLGGHLVQGHVDGTGEFVALEALGDGNWWLKIRVPPEIERYIVFKGSIAIDGISLTAARVEGLDVAATILPHTYENTALASHRPGDRVNIECDVLAKYVEKLLAAFSGRADAPRLTAEKLRDLGY